MPAVVPFMRPCLTSDTAVSTAAATSSSGGIEQGASDDEAAHGGQGEGLAPTTA